MKIKCPNCKYEWDTKSKLLWVTCPSCRLKVQNLPLLRNQTKKQIEEDKSNLSQQNSFMNMIKKKDGTKVTFKQFIKEWWGGMRKVKLVQDINKEVNDASQIYNDKR